MSELLLVGTYYRVSCHLVIHLEKCLIVISKKKTNKNKTTLDVLQLTAAPHRSDLDCTLFTFEDESNGSDEVKDLQAATNW